MFNEKKAPNPSPKSPEADLSGLKFLSEVSEQILQDLDAISEEIFDHLLNFSNEEILQNGISEEGAPSKIAPHLRSLNLLLPLAFDAKTGSIKNLNAENVRILSPRIYATIAVLGGSNFVEAMCDIINTEIKERVTAPKSSVFPIATASPLSATSNQIEV